MKPWSVEECESYAKQLRNKTRANTAEHAAQAIEYLLGLVGREWVGLTEEEKNDCLVSADPCECLAKPESHQLMEDVEAKLREKNT